jgi:hypothetical protein
MESPIDPDSVESFTQSGLAVHCCVHSVDKGNSVPLNQRFQWAGPEE